MKLIPSATSTKRMLAGAVACAFLTSASACSGTLGSAAPVAKIEQPKAAEASLPDQILGLRVVQEDISKDIAQVESATYFSSVALFSMREGDLLQASFQIASLNNLAKPDNEKFRKDVAGRMGGSSSVLTIGAHKVYMTFGKQQFVYAWFKGRGFHVLTVRRAFPFRRTLLRKLLALEELA